MSSRSPIHTRSSNCKDSQSLAGDEKRITDWLGNDLTTALGSEVEVMWLSPSDTEGESGFVAVHLMTPSGVVGVD